MQQKMALNFASHLESDASNKKEQEWIFNKYKFFTPLLHFLLGFRFFFNSSGLLKNNQH